MKHRNIYIILATIIIGLVVIVVLSRRKQIEYQTNYEQEKKKRDSIELVLSKVSDSLVHRDQYFYKIIDSLNNLENHSTIIYNQKIKDVDNLPIDSSINFIDYYYKVKNFIEN